MLLRIGLAILVGFHGIGHILFLVPLLGIADWGQSTHSWLLGGGTPARLIGSVLWVAAIVGFSAAAYGLFDQQTWWRDVAIIASIISTSGLIIFWANPVTSPVIAALTFNMLVLGLLLILHWPNFEIIGA